MKLTNFILFSFFIVTTVSAQPGIVDSFKNKLNASKADTSRVNLLIAWAEYYNEDVSDSVVMLSQQGLDLARKLHYSKGEVRCLVNMGNAYYGLGNYVKAVQVFQQAMTLSNEIDYPEGNMRAFGLYTLTYYLQGDYRRELSYHLHVEQQARKLNNLPFIIMGLGQAGKAYVELRILDSATFYLNKTYLLLKQVHFNHPKAALFVIQMGVLSRIKDEKVLALSYLRQAIPICMATNAKARLTTIYLSIADIYKSDKQMDSALYYAKKAFSTAHENTFKFLNIARASFWLSEMYDTMHNYQESMYYAKLGTQASDSLLNQDKVNQLSNLIFSEQLQQQQLKAAEDRYRNQIKFYASLAALVVLLFVGLTLFRSNRQNRQAKIKIESAYEELKTTQSQLVQKEKMASLGELTAGIAHEIQNPLNFVNNFSEMNNELADELEQEIDKGNYTDAKAIAKDIKNNGEKINHHGRRADAIVKGMLQHSRSSSGVKEPTDINALANEYLRLAYHGLRAKDKLFNATMKTDFDKSIGNISIIPQDIGRVILNLLTNAFYAASEKKRQNPNGYEPTVSVSTKKVADKILISVEDNGDGIPQKVLDKIFQPFFTTKPTGQGTGLGLSLSYDIIKAHGGEIKVRTSEGEGSEFIIALGNI